MTDTITLGGRQFELRPLKLGQLRLVLDALDAMTGKSGGALIEAAAGVVAAGLVPAQPGLTADAVLDLEATIDDLNAAVAAVLKIAGLRPQGDAAQGDAAMGEPPPGELPAPRRPMTAPAAAPPGSSLPPFMAPSPPDAAMPSPSSTA